MSTDPFRTVDECDKRHAESVTQEDCKPRHRSLLAQITSIFVLLSLLMGGIAWATITAGTVKRDFAVHEAAQNECTKHLNETLKRIEADGKATRVIVDKIYRNGNHP